MITEKNHKLLTSQLFVTDCTKKGLASMQQLQNEGIGALNKGFHLSSLSHFDWLFFRSLASVKISKVKYVVWSSDMSFVALLSKHGE